MEIVHRPGKKHTNADGMSRLRDVIPECDCYNAGARALRMPLLLESARKVGKIQ